MNFRLKALGFHTLLLLCTATFSARAESWDLNDVSYLYPLPSSSSDSSYLKIKDFIPLTWITETLAESKGVPFTIDVIPGATTISPDRFRELAIANFNTIRLLAMRIDPCFKDLFSDPCRPQMRAVWQPVKAGSNTADATIHTFYDLSPSEFKDLADQLLQLKAKYKVTTAGLPLQVHPGFKKTGFSKDLSTLIKNWLKPDHLTRIAFMKLIADEFRWRFTSFNVKDGKLNPIQIPLHSNVQQTFAIHGGTIPPGTLELSEEELSRSRNGERLDRILLDYALRIENPRLNIPGTTDCLSCHASGGLKGTATDTLGLNEIPTVASVIGLIGKYNLQNTTKNREDLIHFRAFGYVFKIASISDRVIMESALVADTLNR